MHRLAAFFCTLCLCACAWAQAGWDGRYTYGATYGKTAGGSPVVMDYALKIAGGSCRFSMDGFQTQEELLCSVSGNADKITLLFKSYADGEVLNSHGVAVYKPGQPLFALERKGGKDLWTTWLDMEGPDGKRPAPGRQFRPARP